MFNFWRKKINAVIRAVEYLDIKTSDIIVLYSEQTIPTDIKNDLYNSARKALDAVNISNEIILLTHGMRLLLLRKRI